MSILQHSCLAALAVVFLQSGNDQVFAFSGIIGTTRASIEICRVNPDTYAQAISTAEFIAQARYKQAGLSAQDEGRDEERAYQGYLRTHKAVPSLPDCALLSRQADNLNQWSAQQGAAFIDEAQLRPSGR